MADHRLGPRESKLLAEQQSRCMAEWISAKARERAQDMLSPWGPGLHLSGSVPALCSGKQTKQRDTGEAINLSHDMCGRRAPVRACQKCAADGTRRSIERTVYSTKEMPYNRMASRRFLLHLFVLRVHSITSPCFPVRPVLNCLSVSAEFTV